MYYKCCKINFNCVESYIDSPDWKQIKATIDPRNDDDKCFQYAAMVTLKHEKIGLYPDRVSRIRPFINK